MQQVIPTERDGYMRDWTAGILIGGAEEQQVSGLWLALYRIGCFILLVCVSGGVYTQERQESLCKS